MTRQLAAVALVALVFGAQSVGAQSDGPRPGSWGVEAASGPAASLLRFRSATSAWVLGGTGQYARAEIDDFDPFTGTTTRQTQETFGVQLRAGLRRYSTGSSSLRRFTTVSAVLGYDKSTLGRGWTYGAGAEYGAAYFFSPRVSLGGSGDLSLTYQSIESDNALLGDRQTWTLRFSGFRLLGAVYF